MASKWSVRPGTLAGDWKRRAWTAHVSDERTTRVMATLWLPRSDDFVWDDERLLKIAEDYRAKLDDQVAKGKLTNFVYQVEKSKEGFPHFQIYAERANKVRNTFKQWHEVLDHRIHFHADDETTDSVNVGVHLEYADESAERCKSYCSKERTRAIDGLFTNSLEWARKKSEQGKRNELEAAAAMAIAGATEKELSEKHPTTFVKFHAGLNKVRLLHEKGRNGEEPVKSVYIEGTTGYGKTSGARLYLAAAGFSEDEIYIWSNKQGRDWWDGYTNQPAILIDDLAPGVMPVDKLQRLCDPTGVPVLLGVHGGVTQCYAHTVIITTNHRFSDMFEMNKVSSRVYDSLLRRITIVKADDIVKSHHEICHLFGEEFDDRVECECSHIRGDRIADVLMEQFTLIRENHLEARRERVKAREAFAAFKLKMAEKATAEERKADDDDFALPPFKRVGTKVVKTSKLPGVVPVPPVSPLTTPGEPGFAPTEGEGPDDFEWQMAMAEGRCVPLEITTEEQREFWTQRLKSGKVKGWGEKLMVKRALNMHESDDDE